jgi:rhodanese-related sulfurtransferase
VDFFIFISEQWLLVSLLLVLVYGFAMLERSRGGKPLTPAQVVAELNAERAVLLDVRDAKEYAGGHIHGALHIPHSKVANQLHELNKYREKTIILACKMGQSAAATGKLLTKQGYTVRRLGGGMMEWGNQGMPVVTKASGKGREA